MTAFQVFGALFIGASGLIGAGCVVHDLYRNRHAIMRALGL